MNPLPFIPAFLILPVLFSCTQKSNLEIATGKVTTIKLGNVVRIKEINVLTSTDDGTFANMAGTAAEAMTPGIIGMGTSKLASATGSIVDGRVEAVKMIRVRVKLKDTNELVEVQQEVTPNFTLKIGQEVVIKHSCRYFRRYGSPWPRGWPSQPSACFPRRLSSGFPRYWQERQPCRTHGSSRWGI